MPKNEFHAVLLHRSFQFADSFDLKFRTLTVFFVYYTVLKVNSHIVCRFKPKYLRTDFIVCVRKVITWSVTSFLCCLLLFPEKENIYLLMLTHSILGAKLGG
jgi:hypothetical protein